MELNEGDNKGHKETVTALLEVNAEDNEGHKPSELAGMSGHLEVFSALSKAEESVNSTDNKGWFW